MQGTKTGGRKAGTPNRVTRELREALKAVISNELDQIDKTLSQMPAKDRLELIIKLLPYCMPKIDSIGGKYDSSRLDWD